MTDPIRELDCLVEEAATRYTRLVLLVGPHGSGKTDLLHRFAAEHDVPVICVGSSLSDQMLGTPLRQLPVTAADSFGELVRECCGEQLALIDNIELLFLPLLHLDPLKLLQDVARNRTVVAAWPQQQLAATLNYGEPGHPEFRAFSEPDTLTLTLPQ